MNCTLDCLPEIEDVILVLNNITGSLELVKYPFKRRPYTWTNFRNWWENYNDQEFFSHWTKIDVIHQTF